MYSIIRDYECYAILQREMRANEKDQERLCEKRIAVNECAK